MWKTLLELLFDYKPNEPILQSCFARLEWQDYGCPTYDLYLFEYGDHRWVSIQGKIPKGYSGTSFDVEVSSHHDWCKIVQWLQSGDHSRLTLKSKVSKWSRIRSPSLPGACIYRVYGDVPVCFEREVLNPNPAEATVRYNGNRVSPLEVHWEEHF